MATCHSGSERVNRQAARSMVVRCVLAGAAWLASAGVASACPDCNIGRVARAQFWHDQFAWNLTVALVPFVVIAGVSALCERIGGRAHPHSARGE